MTYNTNATPDYAKMMQDMMSAYPMDMSAMQDGFKSYAAFGERMSKVAIDAAEKSTEISAKWTKDTLGKMSGVTTVRDEPADYAKSMTDFASGQAEMNAEAMAQFAEVAKRVQMDTVELMMAAGKDMSEDMTVAAKKAQGDAAANARQVTETAQRATADATDRMKNTVKTAG